LEIDEQKLLGGVKDLDLNVSSAGTGMRNHNIALRVTTCNPAIPSLQADRVDQRSILIHLEVGKSVHRYAQESSDHALWRVRQGKETNEDPGEGERQSEKGRTRGRGHGEKRTPAQERARSRGMAPAVHPDA
jgi:hypothetical protein